MITPHDVEDALEHRGFIIDDGSALAGHARNVWDSWWSDFTPLTISDATDRLNGVLAQPRPQVSPHFTTRESRHNADGAYAWVRNDLVVIDDGGKLPYHHTLEEMAEYLHGWTKSAAERDLAGAYWILHQRPGGYSGAVGTNGHHRSLLAAAAGIPIVRVKLESVHSWDDAPPAEFPRDSFDITMRYDRRQSLTMKVSPRSWPFRAMKRLARNGLCRIDSYRIDSLGSGTLRLRDIDPLAPWIFAKSRRDVQQRYVDFCNRFGYDHTGSWKHGAAGLTRAR